ncbi:MAG: phospholipid carrier-dependent glycosyltransferase [Firmicutes bacterium]|nr:phospholipid carrier-dependent glycosyltransferase [Bacillota bacterium]
MLTVYLISIFSLLIAYLIYYSVIEPNSNKKQTFSGNGVFWAAALAALGLRLFFAAVYQGHETDISCFNSWTDMLYKNGLANFYISDSFTDYPPGYMYILYIIGFVKNTLTLSQTSSYILLKFPAILCDIFCAYIVYKIAVKHTGSTISTVIAALLLFNPAVITDSAIWGQIDSVYTFLVLLMLYQLSEKKMAAAYFIFAAAIFVKPQALFYSPVLLYGIIVNVFMDNCTTKKVIKNLLFALASLASIFIFAMPFGISPVIEQYKSTLASYAYASVNAYNFWAAIGMNWAELTPFVSFIGYFSIVIAVLVSAYIFFKRKSVSGYFHASAFICLCVFMFSVKMHDRYAYPVIALFLCSFAASKRRGEFFLFCGISVLQFINMAHVLFFYNPKTYSSSGFAKTAVVLGCITFVYFIAAAVYSTLSCRHCDTAEIMKPHNATSPSILPEKTSVLPRITKAEIIALCVITAVYSLIAFYNLGDRHAPQTYTKIPENSSIKIELAQDTNISSVKYYIGPRELSDERNLTFNFYDANGTLLSSAAETKATVFFWSEFEQLANNIKYITISTSQKQVYLMELGIYDEHSRLITPVSAPTELFDEQSVVPEKQSYKNSTYFDEIYHARTAYEFIHKLPVYEWTHPPLGKILISLGVQLFGMTPFGWRIAGTLFGIFMIPVIFILSKKMFGFGWLATVCTVLFSFDFMHFTQTRIATIDVYVTFFIILMYLFMYKYCTMSFYDSPLKKTFVPLGLCGISMGFAIACKWTGIYASVGLAVIFFTTMYKRFREDKVRFKSPALKTIAFCILMFIFVPLTIYVLSYIPFLRANGSGITGIIKNQSDMLDYHGKTVVSSTHPFSSHWYEWPIMVRPIWYYSGQTGTKYEEISAFGNPLVWWIGISAFCYCLYSAIRHRDKNAFFLSVAYISQLAPWIPITRTTFIYHYFPCVPFVVLMIGYSINQLFLRDKRFKKYAYIYAVCAVLLFVAFYPVISGFPVSHAYVVNFLRWFPSWQLISG